ncbi:uncharacterized protein isoform X2 [Choristoneura fumiferana]|uniref:uncharacterized protein isoform X2 n=1 Tax=Choristoneura fumiferana TaxID=7141 RepID=UPI003D15EBA8
MITLSWIRADPSRWQVFVANRVAQIQELTIHLNWSYVNTVENPADAVSRGQMPQDFIKNNLWFQGPSWLTFDREQWQVPPQLCSAVVEEAKQVALASHEAPESYMSTISRTTADTNNGRPAKVPGDAGQTVPAERRRFCWAPRGKRMAQQEANDSQRVCLHIYLHVDQSDRPPTSQRLVVKRIH